MSEISVSGFEGVSINKQLCIGFYRRFPGRNISSGNKRCVDIEALEDIIEQIYRSAEQAARGNNMVTGGKQPHDAGKYG